MRRLEHIAVKKIKKDSFLWKSLSAIHRPIMNSVYAGKRRLQYRKSLTFSRFDRGNFYDLETYCMFIGYPRSGHSIVGALMDAHPNMIISHELGAISLVEHGFNKNQILSLILRNSQFFANKGRKWSGYSYEVPNQFQGKFKKIKVIGDKKGGVGSKILNSVPRLKSLLDMPVKFIHVTRNPFDNISTMAMKLNEFSKVTTEADIEDAIKQFFELALVNDNFRKIKENDVLDIKHEKLIDDPKGFLKDICNFLGVEASESYLDDCASIVFAKPHKTRDKLNWTPDLIERVEKEMKKYDFFADYSFDN